VRSFALRFVDDEGAVKRWWLWLLTQDRSFYSSLKFELLITNYLLEADTTS
jgi:hypothetical protein